MQVVWNYLSLPIIPGIMVKTCLLHSTLPTCFFGRHHASLSQTPQVSVSHKASPGLSASASRLSC